MEFSGAYCFNWARNQARDDVELNESNLEDLAREYQARHLSVLAWRFLRQVDQKD